MGSLIQLSRGDTVISRSVQKISVFLATGFGSGYAPKAPGTFGTLVAIPIYLLMENLPWLAYIALVTIMTVAGVWLCNQAERHFKGHDHKSIVWDEIVGYLITMTLAPAGWLWILIGFGLFRFFDILKPWPVNWVDQKIDGGLGVMMDDVIAGIYAFIAMGLLEQAWLRFAV